MITNGLVFLSVLALVLFGGDVLRAFSLALFIGVVLLFPKGIVGSLSDGLDRIKPLWDKSYVPQPKTETPVEAEAS